MIIAAGPKKNLCPLVITVNKTKTYLHKGYHHRRVQHRSVGRGLHTLPSRRPERWGPEPGPAEAAPCGPPETPGEKREIWLVICYTMQDEVTGD